MNLDQGEALIDDVRVGEIRGELVHGGLRIFAVRALEVSELDEFQVFACSALGWAVSALNERAAVFRVGMLSERQDFSAGDDVLAVRQSEELERAGLLIAFFTNEDYYAADAWDAGLGNALNLI